MYKDVHDFGTYKEPFSDDLRFKECTCEAGVRLFSAQLVSTALL